MYVTERCVSQSGMLMAASNVLKLMASDLQSGWPQTSRVVLNAAVCS